MIWDLLFPKYCLGCRSYGKYICDGCFKKVRHQGRRGSNFSLFRYEGVIRKAIIALKYKLATDLVKELVGVILPILKKDENFKSGKYLLIPIPLHKRRENWRGFNQSELLGKEIADKMDWEFIPDLLKRIKYTKPQVELVKKERMKNVSGIFEFNRKYGVYKDRKIIIFDDVYTTGSTISEAKRILDKNGFRNVFGLTITS